MDTSYDAFEIDRATDRALFPWDHLVPTGEGFHDQFGSEQSGFAELNDGLGDEVGDEVGDELSDEVDDEVRTETTATVGRRTSGGKRKREDQYTTVASMTMANRKRKLMGEDISSSDKDGSLANAEDNGPKTHKKAYYHFNDNGNSTSYSPGVHTASGLTYGSSLGTVLTKSYDANSSREDFLEDSDDEDEQVPRKRRGIMGHSNPYADARSLGGDVEESDKHGDEVEPNDISREKKQEEGRQVIPGGISSLEDLEDGRANHEDKGQIKEDSDKDLAYEEGLQEFDMDEDFDADGPTGSFMGGSLTNEYLEYLWEME